MRVVNNITNWYNYNAQNKLARIRGAGFTNEFVYDSQNRRIALSQNGMWRADIHAGNIVVAECTAITGAWRVARWFVRALGIAEGIGDVIAEVNCDEYSTPSYYIYNHRGDVLMACGSGGGLWGWLQTFDAFGNLAAKRFDPWNARYTFSTKEYLPDAKLYLYAYRVYDPQAGRWTQRDPIDYQDSLNLYQFCGNNPVNVLDVDGRIEFYGNWGGPDWTGGQTRPYESLTPGQQAVLIAPIDSMDDLFQTHDLAYSAARVTERNAIDAATKARNEALKNASLPEQVAMANKISTKAIREAQSQCRRALNQADDNLLQGLSQLDSDPSRWQRPAPDAKQAAKRRPQAQKAISWQRKARAD